MHGAGLSSVIRCTTQSEIVTDEDDCRVDDEDRLESLSPIICINVGGQRFETTQRTLSKRQSRLSRLSKDSHFWRAEREEYFFDRDPTIFRCILGFHRTGELHLPLDVCGPHLENELSFWKVSDKKIDKCCWIHYIRLKGQKASLLEFERFFSCKEPENKSVDCKCENADWKFRLRRAFNSFRQKGWIFFQRPQTRLSMSYAILSSVIVVLSILSLICSSMEYFVKRDNRNIKINVSNSSTTASTDLMNDNNSQDWLDLEIVDFTCVIFFSVDIFFQFVCATNRCVFLRNPMTITEILAIFPYYCDFIGHTFNLMQDPKLRALIEGVHVMRIFGVMRIFKLLKHQTGIQVLFYTLKTSLRELLLMTTFVCVAMLIFSSLIYFLDDRKIFTNIPICMWWAIVTLTTVGYGDYYPKTIGGYIAGSLCALTGVLVVAFTVPILVNSFMLFYSYAYSVHVHRETCEKPNKRLGQLFAKGGLNPNNSLAKNLMQVRKAGSTRRSCEVRTDMIAAVAINEQLE